MVQQFLTRGVGNKFGWKEIKALPLQTQTREGGKRVSAKQALVAMRTKEIFPRSIAGVKIVFVSLQSRSLHERGSNSKGFGFREVECDNEIFEKLDI